MVGRWSAGMIWNAPGNGVSQERRMVEKVGGENVDGDEVDGDVSR